MITPAGASEVLLHAAGSLRDALTEVAGAYEKASGNTVRGTYGASGTLRDRIAVGERAEVFASANMAHPQSFAQASSSEHRNDVTRGFTSEYTVHRLVYYEQFFDIENAIRREKRLKKWNRAWKIRLIEQSNPNWDDLYPVIASP